MNGLALCAGGMLGLEHSVKKTFPAYRTVCFVEGEAFAVQHLVKKMEEGRLDYAPIWSNLITFDGKPWSGKVDIITSGFPCQPFSSLGKKLGEDDQRDLWPHVARIIGEVRPKLIFLENVPNIVNRRLDSIILDLDKMGFNCSWCVIPASSVGAPHKRERWFLLGMSNANSLGRRKNQLNSQERKQLHPKRVGDEQREYVSTHWQIEPSMDRLVDGASDWVDKLRLLGNGVVPQQAYSALQILGARLACGIVANREPKG